MLGTFKNVKMMAVAAVAGAGLFAGAQGARADRFSIGFSYARPVYAAPYCPPQTVYAPRVVYQSYGPQVAYYMPSAPRYYSTYTPVYTAPVYAPPVYAPVYATPAYCPPTPTYYNAYPSYYSGGYSGIFVGQYVNNGYRGGYYGGGYRGGYAGGGGYRGGYYGGGGHRGGYSVNVGFGGRGGFFGFRFGGR